MFRWNKTICTTFDGAKMTRKFMWTNYSGGFRKNWPSSFSILNRHFQRYYGYGGVPRWFIVSIFGGLEWRCIWNLYNWKAKYSRKFEGTDEKLEPDPNPRFMGLFTDYRRFSRQQNLEDLLEYNAKVFRQIFSVIIDLFLKEKKRKRNSSRILTSSS